MRHCPTCRCDSLSLNLEAQPNAEEVAMFRAGDKISAIRKHRERTGLGLVESKFLLERRLQSL